MTRLALEPDNQFATILKGLLDDIEQLKRPQIIGASSLISNYTKTGNIWDINGFSVSSYEQKIWQVVFTPDPGQNDKPYGEIAFAWDVGNSDFSEIVEWYPAPDNVTNDAIRAWVVIFNNGANNVGFFARFGVKSSHKGILSINLVS